MGGFTDSIKGWKYTAPNFLKQKPAGCEGNKTVYDNLPHLLDHQRHDVWETKISENGNEISEDICKVKILWP